MSSGEDEDTFPVSNYGELVVLEDKLKTHANCFNKIVQILRRKGGVEVRRIIYGSLRYLISNSLAEQFSWAGFKGKKAFKDMQIAKIIFKTVRLLKNDATDDIIIEGVSKWLAQPKLWSSRDHKKNEIMKLG